MSRYEPLASRYPSLNSVPSSNAVRRLAVTNTSLPSSVVSLAPSSPALSSVGKYSPPWKTSCRHGANDKQLQACRHQARFSQQGAPRDPLCRPEGQAFLQRPRLLSVLPLNSKGRTRWLTSSLDMLSGPICAMVWEGRDAVKTGRTLLGATNPLASAPGTIRGDYAIVSGFGICVLRSSALMPFSNRMLVVTSATAPTASKTPRRRLTSGSSRKSLSPTSTASSTGSTRRKCPLLEHRM